MTSALESELSRRLSVPLTRKDEEYLSVLRISPLHREHLGGLCGTKISPDFSDANLVHALVDAGYRALKESIEEAGYAQLSRDPEESVEVKVAIARRRSPYWEREE